MADLGNGAAISQTKARIALAGLSLLLIWGLTTPTPQVRRGTSTNNDVVLFETVARRIRSGESYYPAMGSELRARGYPTASVFNWRMPFPVAAVATFPRLVMVVFFGLGVLCLAGTIALLMREAPEAMLLGVLAQVGVTISLLKLPQYVLMADVWGGLLIMTSVLAYARRRWTTGAALGVLALLVRELAAPYCLVCGIIALAQKRWRESALWALGAIVYGAYFLAHVYQVSAQLGPQDLAHRQPWLQFGGLPFLLRVIGFSGWYDVLPTWSRSVGCVLLVAAAWALRAPLQMRAAVLAYIVFFSVVGQPFNHYWGLVTAPMFALGTGYGLTGLTRLVRAAAPAEQPMKQNFGS